MKPVSAKKSKYTLFIGLAGLIICALLVIYAEFWLQAPNDSTLVYRQWQLFAAAILLLVASIAFILKGTRDRRLS